MSGPSSSRPRIHSGLRPTAGSLATGILLGLISLAVGVVSFVYRNWRTITGLTAAVAVGAIGLGITGALMIAAAAAPAIHGGGTAAVATLLHHFSFTSLAAIGSPANIGEQLLPWAIGAGAIAATGFSSWRTWQSIRPTRDNGVEAEAREILESHGRGRKQAALPQPGPGLQPNEPSTVLSTTLPVSDLSPASLSAKQPPLDTARRRLARLNTSRMAKAHDLPLG